MRKPDHIGIISGHIYTDDVDEKTRVETLSFIHNDDLHNEAFCEIDDAILENIETHGCEDYYFIAIVTATFTQEQTLEGTEYDVEYTVKEINNSKDLPALGMFAEQTRKEENA